MVRWPALAVATLLVLTGCGDGSSSTAPPAPTVVEGRFRCPDPQTDPARAVDRGSDALPTGARAARLCLLDNNDAWSPPTSVLTTRVDDLVGVVNAQRVHHPEPDTGCGGVGAPAWTMVFRYDHGTRTISGDNGGCWDLVVGGTQRFGSAHVYDAYLRALVRQRHAEPPPQAEVTAPSCPHGAYPSASPAADPRLLVSAVWCHRAGAGWRRAPAMSPAQLATLRHDIRTSGSRHGPLRLGRCRGLSSSTYGLLMGRDAWGDLVAVDYSCDYYRLFPPARPRAVFVRMLPSSVAVVAALEHR